MNNYSINRFEEETQFNDEIDFNVLTRIFIRNKNQIIVPSLAISIITGIFTLFQKPVWQGNFTVFVNSEATKPSISSNSLINVIQEKNNLKNEEYILKSPFVLKSVYEYVKSNKYKDSESKYSFNEWIKSTSLNVKVEKGSDIIEVSYKDQNKEFILNVLNKIASAYKAYSVSEINKDLDQQIEFLIIQEKNYKKKYLDSLKTFNKFSIENGLGDIDGFVNLGKSKSQSINGNLSTLDPNIASQINIQSGKITRKNDAGQRFAKQFELLELLETEYINYSSMMKKESKYLTNLKSKIENLKSSLKRPNEILVTYRELQNKLDRNELIYNDIEDNLITLKIERAKDKKVWDIISKPTIKKDRISPQRKKAVTLAFLISLFGTYIFSFFKERSSDNIFEFNEIKKLLKLNFREIFEKKDYFFNQNFLSELKKENDLFLYKVSDLSEENKLKEYLKINFISDETKFCYETDFNNEKRILALIEEGKVTKNDIKNLNKYKNLYPESFIGWIFLKS